MLPSDDQAPDLTSADYSLIYQLEYAISNYFYTSCDLITRALLAQCQWSINTSLDIPTLTIVCPDSLTYWHIANNIEPIGKYLSNLVCASRIEVVPEDRRNIYFEVEIGA